MSIKSQSKWKEREEEEEEEKQKKKKQASFKSINFHFTLLLQTLLSSVAVGAVVH